MCQAVCRLSATGARSYRIDGIVLEFIRPFGGYTGAGQTHLNPK